MTKQEIEKKIEAIESDIFILEMKDHLSSAEFTELSQLNSRKNELISQLNGMK